ncbi:hypothetical protein GCM10009754_09560 [Amycolatopsis minnesotensis]|uniref:Uncharacterized protein n=1 Tax=Amycolatopsis minnesotensis TaxID=337894 RepID=A0ABP5BJ70_9PSEU
MLSQQNQLSGPQPHRSPDNKSCTPPYRPKPSLNGNPTRRTKGGGGALAIAARLGTRPVDQSSIAQVMVRSSGSGRGLQRTDTTRVDSGST